MVSGTFMVAKRRRAILFPLARSVEKVVQAPSSDSVGSGSFRSAVSCGLSSASIAWAGG